MMGAFRHKYEKLFSRHDRTRHIPVMGRSWSRASRLYLHKTGLNLPASYGVHVCSPVNGSTISSPVTVQASAKVAGSLARMEVWVDGVKKYTESDGTALTTKLSLAKGKHLIGVIAVNTAGTKYSGTANVTVN